MRLRAFGHPLALALFILAACESKSAEGVASDSARITPLTGPLALLATPIDTLVTLGAWLSTHPGDVVQDSVPVGADSKQVCRIASARVDLAGRHFVRHALFNVPSPPDGELLPDTVQLAERQCHLRGIWFTATDPDSVRVIALADSIAHVLDASLGASTPGVALGGSGTGRWVHGHSWVGQGARIVTGVLPARAPVTNEQEDGDVVVSKVTTAGKPAQLLVVSVAPHSGLDRDEIGFNERYTQEDAEEALDYVRADSALTWAGVPALTASLRPLIAELTSYDSATKANTASTTPAVDSALVRSATILHDALPSVDPARRAAAMLAMDLVLQHAKRGLNADSVGPGAWMLHALDSAGAHYEYEHMGGGFFYTRDWLWASYHLDSLGRAGHAAFLALLASGWATRPGCERNPNEKGDVTEHATAALKRGDNDPLIHYFAGLADHDIVSLASGSFDSDYVDPKRYAPLAPAARVRAIAHLRAALAGLKDKRLRQHAWRTATAFMLGHSLETRFFCVND